MYYNIAQTADDRWLLDNNEFQDETSLLQIGVFNSCACGMPEENLEYILGGLELIADRGPDNLEPFDNSPEWTAWWNKHQQDTLAHHGNERAAYFFYYWADNLGLTEHGGSVPGWLTGKGEEILDHLQAWHKRQQSDLAA